MNREAGYREPTLDDAVAAVRADQPPAGAAEAAAGRVGRRLAQEAGDASATVEAIRGCVDVRGLFAPHRAGALAAPRALLVEDHLRECAPCRAAFRDPGGRGLAVLPWRPAAPAAAPAPRSRRAWAVAAAVILAAGLGALGVRQAFFAPPPGSRAAVLATTGLLQRVSDGVGALSPGEELGEDEAVRTASGAGARLRLRDGSIVEMGERAELSVTARGRDTTVHLRRGRVIVQAAKRTAGRLLVAANDCTVEVTGTVFSVNRGVTGSRVSVVEGQVKVVRAGRERVLRPGEQWATSEAMGTVPLRDEVAWSRDADRYLALLAEVQALREDLKEVRTPGLRYEARLLRRVPAGAVLFVAFPNYGEALADAHRIFQQRLGESAVLRQWWETADPARHGEPSLESVIERVRTFADYLGDEVALAMVADGRGRPVPLFLAEVRRPGLREHLEEQMAAAPRTDGGPVLRFLDEGAPAAGGAGLWVLARPDLLALAPDAAVLRGLAGDEVSGLEATAFGQRLAAAYSDGVAVLFGADVERIVGAAAGNGPRDARAAVAFHRSGFDGLRHVIVEHRDLAGAASTRAAFSFAGPRRGLASWLASPGPMGSLEFVSPNAQLVGAGLLQSPSRLLDDVLGVVKARDPRAPEALAEVESRLSLRLREDVAQALGGEVALALDGPLFPVPAWKLVVEVVDPLRLQTSLEVLLARAADEAADAGRPGLRLDSELVDGRTFHAVRGGLPFEVHYAFAEGYLVAGPSRAVVMQAVRTRESGSSLARSPGFRGLFPPDRRPHVSGLLYQNLGPAVSRLLDAGMASLSPEQRRSAEALAREAGPTLLCAYGEEDAILLAGRGGVLDLEPAQLALPLLLERLGRPRAAGTPRGPAS